MMTHRSFVLHEKRFLGFTLIELLMAVFAASVILTSLYGVFSQALKRRDELIERTRLSALRARAASVIRNDLQNAIITGIDGGIADMVEGSREATHARFPGSLRFTTTTGRESSEELFGDVQEVEYYIDTDPDAPNAEAGVLVRALDRNLLGSPRAATREEPLLAGVSSMEVEFFDGSSWIDSWAMTDQESEVPVAVRVRLLQRPDNTAAHKTAIAPPLEIVVPWSTQRSP
jgi:type II secretion system protein J